MPPLKGLGPSYVSAPSAEALGYLVAVPRSGTGCDAVFTVDPLSAVLFECATKSKTKIPRAAPEGARCFLFSAPSAEALGYLVAVPRSGTGVTLCPRSSIICCRIESAKTDEASSTALEETNFRPHFAQSEALII